jgi:CBS domain-containing protein
MQTDFFTVRPDDPIAFVAELMGWERIRHVAVEDDKGRLVGLVSYRGVLRYLSELARHATLADPSASPQSAPASKIMRTELITVVPDTPMREAVDLMRSHRVGCLPVVHDGHIVAMLTEEDFVEIASRLIRDTASTTDVSEHLPVGEEEGLP